MRLLNFSCFRKDPLWASSGGSFFESGAAISGHLAHFAKRSIIFYNITFILMTSAFLYESN